MPGWGEILEEINASAPQPGAPPDFDGVRRKYLVDLTQHTGRSLIVYETDWMGGGPPGVGITLEDMQAMMEVCRDLPGPELDLILSSPGGSAEATASIVRYLREKFSDIRVFIPIAAMSASTMWALGCNTIVMGKHSQLGPIDPQLVTPQGNIPARAILDQFDRAKRECSQDPSALGAWAPILQQYGPALLEQCENAEALAKRLVREWLEAYMFAGESDAAERATRVAEFFANHRLHQSHAMGISRDVARDQGLNVELLEDDQELQDKVLSVHHACARIRHDPQLQDRREQPWPWLLPAERSDDGPDPVAATDAAPAASSGRVGPATVSGGDAEIRALRWPRDGAPMASSDSVRHGAERRGPAERAGVRSTEPRLRRRLRHRAPRRAP